MFKVNILGYWFIRVPLFVGQINIKPNRSELFSERNNLVPVVRVFGVSFIWRKWK